jgi:hypothetical protein
MKRSLPLAALGLLAVCLVLPTSSLADPAPALANPLLIGALSYDTGVVPGVDTFDLYNLTGGVISPDGVVDPEVFSGTLTVDVAGVGDEVFTYNDVDIYGDNATLASFLPSTDILSAELSLLLSNSAAVNVFDDNGNLAVANLSGVPETSLPLNGGAQLTPCDGTGNLCSSAAIYVNAVPATSMPEPSALWLLASGLGSVLVVRRRWLRKK